MGNKSTQGQWHRLAVAALLVLVAICWFLVLGGRAGAAGQGQWTNQGEWGEVGRGLAAHREGSLGLASGKGIQPYVWVLCVEPWE